ncbi:MAG: VanZ family protein [Propioniciclava sp.]
MSQANRWPIAVALIAVLIQSVALYWPELPAQAGPGIPGLDKVVHVVLFATTTWAVAWAFGLRWAVAAMVLQLSASELAQGALLPGRTADPWDAAADALGIAVGVIAHLRGWFLPQGARQRIKTPVASGQQP